MTHFDKIPGPFGKQSELLGQVTETTKTTKKVKRSYFIGITVSNTIKLI